MDSIEESVGLVLGVNTDGAQLSSSTGSGGDEGWGRQMDGGHLVEWRSCSRAEVM